MHGIRRGLPKIRLQAIISIAYRPLAFLGGGILLAIFGGTRSVSAQSVSVTAGYRDFYFGKGVNDTPTGEKPQSKLWWNDGIWWGSLWDPLLYKYTIHRFDVATQSWTSTGTAIDDRPHSKADALWDGQSLYVVSQIFTHSPGPASLLDAGRLYRYHYDSATKRYLPDLRFPVNVNGSTSETLVLAKDSTGKLWVTWTEGGKVKVNRSLGDDLTWGAPFDLPVQGDDIFIDDISSILAFGGNKIGIMWSNQNDKITYFAVHLDGNADEAWEPREQALVDPNLGQISYDHINLKPSCDDGGHVYAATKTSLTKSGAPLIYLLKRDVAGVWTRYLVSKVDDGHTRPIVLIDGERNRVYVFAVSNKTGAGVIYMKSTDLSNITFPPGLGTPVIESATGFDINNPTSTKQCLNSTTGLLVLAGDADSRYYFHNYVDLSGGVVAVDDEKAIERSHYPDDYQLEQNYPNPFSASGTFGNARTMIEYALPEAARVGLFIYNIKGQQVRKLVDEIQTAGYKQVRWDGRDDDSQEIGSGVFLIRLETGPYRFTKRITLLK